MREILHDNGLVSWEDIRTKLGYKQVIRHFCRRNKKQEGGSKWH